MNSQNGGISWRTRSAAAGIATVILATGVVVIGSTNANAATTNWARTNVTVKLNRNETAYVGATAAVWPVMAAAGAFRNKIGQKVWQIQPVAAWAAAQGVCLQVTVTFWGNVSVGTYSGLGCYW